MALVLVESPFKGRYSRRLDAALNVLYIQDLCRQIALAGAKPFASHLFCTQFLDDADERERALGIEIGFAWGVHAEQTIVGIDRGISSGMRIGIENARAAQRPIVWLSLKAFQGSWLPPDVDREAWKQYARRQDETRMY